MPGKQSFPEDRAQCSKTRVRNSAWYTVGAHCLLLGPAGSGPTLVPICWLGVGGGCNVTASLFPRFLLSGCFWVSGELNTAICRLGRDNPTFLTPKGVN